MRTTNINTVTVTYPNSNVFVYDNIFIQLSDSLYPVGAEINVTNMSSLETKTLVYISERKNLTITLNDVVRRLHMVGGCTLNVKVKAYTDRFYVGTFFFNMETLDGRSMPQRSHGAARTFYVYDQSELQKFQLFLSGSGSLSIGGHSFPVIGGGKNSFDLLSTVTTSGEHPFCYQYGAKGGGGEDKTLSIEITGVEPSVFSAAAMLNYYDIDTQPPADEIKGGGVWSDTKTNLARFCGSIVLAEPCTGFDFMELLYFDTDGCIRYLGGKIQSETTTAKKQNYVGERNSVYRDISQRHTEESGVTVKLAFEDVRRDAYPQDVLLSEHLWFKNYGGDWLPCSLVDSKITVKSDDEMDLELEVELLKQ